MTGDDLIVVGFCGLFGFGVVWLFLSLRSRPEPVREHTNAEAENPHPTHDAAPEWYQVLEVPQTAAIDEIRAAYRRKITQYHPDRVEALGPEFKRMAEARSREINRAFEIACRGRG